MRPSRKAESRNALVTSIPTHRWIRFWTFVDLLKPFNSFRIIIQTSMAMRFNPAVLPVLTDTDYSDLNINEGSMRVSFVKIVFEVQHLKVLKIKSRRIYYSIVLLMKAMVDVLNALIVECKD